MTGVRESDLTIRDLTDSQAILTQFSLFGTLSSIPECLGLIVLISNTSENPAV